MTERQWNELKIGDIIRSIDKPGMTWVVYSKLLHSEGFCVVKQDPKHAHISHVEKTAINKWELVSTIIERRRWYS